MKLAPSLLAADFSNLQKDIEIVNDSNADWFHIDVMDGVFVPNISFGMPVIKAIGRHALKPLDIHLMIINPEKYIDKFIALGASVLTVHYEACPHLHRTLQLIKDKNVKAGVALNPHTPISCLEDIIQDVDLVCLMSVSPGFGGQKFITHTYQKIRTLKTLISSKKSNALIEIDGGVSLDNAFKLYKSGVDVLVAGSSVFRSSNVNQTIQALKQISHI